MSKCTATSEPSTRYWRIGNFSSLEFIQSTTFELYLPTALHLVPRFDFLLVPIGYHSHQMDAVSIVIEHDKSSRFKGPRRTALPERYRNAEVQFRLSFVDSHGHRCNPQLTKMPLFPRDDPLFDQDVELNVPYDYLVDPAHALLTEDQLTILIEATVLGDDRPEEEAKEDNQEEVDFEEEQLDFEGLTLKESTNQYDVQHTWVIEHVSSVRELIRSPEIHPPTWDRMTFHLEFHPYGFAPLCPNAAFVTVRCGFHTRHELKVRYRISVIDGSGQRPLIQEGQSRYNFLGEVSNSYFKLLRSYLFESANALVVKDRLTLHCEIKVISNVKTQQKRPLWPLFSTKT